MDQELIEFINKLQDALAPLGTSANIDLPQITVVGSQSSGKSSVLENIVGRDFLPRGSGIVTRRPLVLQLINVRDSEEEYGVFLHLPDKKFTDFNEIRNEIVRETEAKTGANAGISSVPINLRIYSPKVLTLTLVDLPGLTKVPVGDQPKDIERQIKEMIMKYISKPNAIILSVTAANTDLANSDGLKLAREVDPEGSRTVGVLTKVDLMDRGTDVLDILNGKVIPLRFGYIPVINRSQQDIQNNKAISSALDAERKFFEDHPSYASRASQCGTPYLTKRLNSILMNHIKATLPELREKINTALKKYEQELIRLGPAEVASPQNVVLSTITEFSNEYQSLLDGKSKDVSQNELSGGARISYVFYETFNAAVNSLDPFDMIKDVDIRTILYNSAGTVPSLYVSTNAFEVLIKKQIRRFEEPSLRCVALIFDELVRILNQILQKPQFNRYPALKEKVGQCYVTFLKECMIPTNKLVSDLVHAEASYINTAHPNLIKGHQAVAIVTERMNLSRPTQLDPKTGKPLPNQPSPEPSAGNDDPFGGFFSNFFSTKNKKRLAAMEAPPPILKASGQMSEREAIETEVIKLLIKSYFAIVQRTIADLVPKAIMLNLIVYSREEVQRELLEKLYGAEDMNELVKENAFTAQRRTECITQVDALRKAQSVVSSYYGH